MTKSQFSDLPIVYRGSVKDLRGPVPYSSQDALVFDYTDAYSVFDWGRMPDPLAHKGEALAVLAAHFFEALEKPESWKEFSKSPEALALRKGNRFGAAFNELGEKLQAEGLRTHFLGAGRESSASEQMPFSRIWVQKVNIEKPVLGTVLGRVVPDYSRVAHTPLPRLIPLEVVFRFSCPPGSSLLSRVEKDPEYLASRGYPDLKLDEVQQGPWGFPFLETFTKLESTDRLVSLNEALTLSGLASARLQEVLFLSAWVAGYLRAAFGKAGLELADGKFEWALNSEGSIMLVDAIGPDELRVLKNGTQLSKEFLRNFYRNTRWYTQVEKAKSIAQAQGSADWKRFVGQEPPVLPAELRELAEQIYQSLANRLTGKKWFLEAWDLEKVCERLAEVAR